MPIIHSYTAEWQQKFALEADGLREALPKFEDIQHIGSTSIPGMITKPIIDITILIESSNDADKYMDPLKKLGYRYFPESSSTERHFFRKGDPVEFHLSLAYKDRGTFWNRQIAFRDYLRTHSEAVKEYAELKKQLLTADPSGGKQYLAGKTEFVERILTKTNNT